MTEDESAEIASMISASLFDALERAEDILSPMNFKTYSSNKSNRFRGVISQNNMSNSNPGEQPESDGIDDTDSPTRVRQRVADLSPIATRSDVLPTPSRNKSVVFDISAQFKPDDLSPHGNRSLGNKPSMSSLGFDDNSSGYYSYYDDSTFFSYPLSLLENNRSATGLQSDAMSLRSLTQEEQVDEVEPTQTNTTEYELLSERIGALTMQYKEYFGESIVDASPHPQLDSQNHDHVDLPIMKPKPVLEEVRIHRGSPEIAAMPQSRLDFQAITAPIDPVLTKSKNLGSAYPPAKRNRHSLFAHQQSTDFAEKYKKPIGVQSTSVKDIYQRSRSKGLVEINRLSERLEVLTTNSQPPLEVDPPTSKGEINFMKLESMQSTAASTTKPIMEFDHREQQREKNLRKQQLRLEQISRCRDAAQSSLTLLEQSSSSFLEREILRRHLLDAISIQQQHLPASFSLKDLSSLSMTPTSKLCLSHIDLQPLLDGSSPPQRGSIRRHGGWMIWSLDDHEANMKQRIFYHQKSGVAQFGEPFTFRIRRQREYLSEQPW
jgi:hypothetical protein